MIIMGLDPGLATMGFGVINLERGVYTVIDYGIVSTPKEDTLPVRLSKIEQGVTTLIDTYKPSQISVEELFFSKNITTGISVAEARGVMLLTAVKLIGDEVYEYTPNQIKMAITGYGGADKKQMQLMVQSVLRLKSLPRPDDAADALAVALCHGQVGDNNGIGYEIGASNFTTNKFSEGEIAKIYTYLYVREDTYALYGFSSIEEKTLFLRLIDISGVGPKMAMQILSGADLNSLTVAIATGDVKSLSKIKGLGKKTAELIVVSMRDQVSLDLTNSQSEISAVVEKDAQEAVFALVSLGISNSDAVKIVAEVSKTEKGAENIIREALKRL